MNNRLFTYGSLRDGAEANHLLKKSSLVQKNVWLPNYRMYIKSDYPVAVWDKEPAAKIKGDIYMIDEVVIPEIDKYEGTWYARKFDYRINAWLYIAKNYYIVNNYCTFML